MVCWGYIYNSELDLDLCLTSDLNGLLPLICRDAADNMNEELAILFYQVVGSDEQMDAFELRHLIRIIFQVRGMSLVRISVSPQIYMY